MIKFFKKHKYTSLVTGALTIAIVSGLGGAFIHDKYTHPKLWQKAWDVTDRRATRVFDLWDQCHHKKGFYAVKQSNNQHGGNNFSHEPFGEQLPEATDIIKMPLSGETRVKLLNALLDKQTKRAVIIGKEEDYIDLLKTRNLIAKLGSDFANALSSISQKDHHDHKDGSCCEACSKGLPCTGETEETKKSAEKHKSHSQVKLQEAYGDKASKQTTKNQ